MSDLTPEASAFTASRPEGPLQRIVLTGFMGCGKTTVGRLLASRLGWAFVDMDEELVRRTGRAVARIFAESGEAAFRREESAALADVLEHSPLVLALGGGAPEDPVNRQRLRAAGDTEVVFLRAGFPVLQARCAADVGAPASLPRPLFQDADQARRRFLQREPLYREIAAREIDVTERSAAEVVEAILKAVAPALPPAGQARGAPPGSP